MNKQTRERKSSGKPLVRQYVGTTVAAQTLGVSIGSVQRMVDEGLLEGHLTPGGHRRVAVDSINRYKQTIRMPIVDDIPDNTLVDTVAVFTSCAELMRDLRSDRLTAFIKIIESPMDMLLLDREPGIKFIDFQWLKKYDPEKMAMEKIVDMNACIFNAPAGGMDPGPAALWIQGPMSVDFFKGFCFCARRQSRQP
jgi:excisionase family DNA binding protein